jgi:hypothetical protein
VLPIVLQMQQQQAAEAQQLQQHQAESMLSILAQQVAQMANPLGQAALTQGALPAAPDTLGDPNQANPQDQMMVANSGGG